MNSREFFFTKMKASQHSPKQTGTDAETNAHILKINLKMNVPNSFFAKCYCFLLLLCILYCNDFFFKNQSATIIFYNSTAMTLELNVVISTLGVNFLHSSIRGQYEVIRSHRIMRTQYHRYQQETLAVYYLK